MEERGAPDFALEVDGVRNAEWRDRLQVARGGYCHAGWVSFATQTERRMMDEATAADEEAFMERYGYAEYYAQWERAPPAKHWLHWAGGEHNADGHVLPGTGEGVWVDRPNAWQEALLQLQLVSVGGITDRIYGGGGRLARDEARALIVNLLMHHAYGISGMMDEIAAGTWADQFLLPVGPDTPLYSGTADTATLNSGVVYVFGDEAGGEGSRVGCIWFGDED
jgi:hypothetical protein